MAGPLARLYATLGLDTAGFDKGVTSSQKKAKSFAQTFKTGIGLGAGFSLGAKAATALTDAITGIPNALGDAVAAAREEEAQIALLNTAISQNDRAWDGNIGRIEGVINARQRLGFSDDEQRESLRALVAVTKDSTVALDLQRTAMDLSRLIGKDLATSTKLLGKVWAGNTSALTRYGIVLEKGATSTEAIAEIQRRAAGQAETFANTNEGAAQRAEIAWDNAGENIGSIFTDLVGDFDKAKAELAEGFNDLFSGSGAAEFNRRMDMILTPQVDTRRTFAQIVSDALSGADIDILPSLTRQKRIWDEIDEMAHDAGLTFADIAPAIEKLDAAWLAEGMTAEDATKATDAVLREMVHSLSMAEEGVNALAGGGTGLGFAGFAQTVGTAISEAADKLNAPFATFAKDAPAEVKETFADIRAEIKAGFGSVKQALQGPDGIVDPDTRIKNMGNRLREATAKLAEARQVGDPFGIAKWQAAVDKQRLNLRQFKDQTSGTFRDVQRDTTEKARKTTDNAIAQAHRLIRQYNLLTLYDAGVRLMRSWQAGIKAGSVGFFPGGVPSKMVPPSLATVGPSGGGITVHVNGPIYGGEAGLRQLSREIARAVRLQSRDR